MLIDEIDIKIKAGDGGEGKVSFGKLEKSGPDGGNGGKGGDVINFYADVKKIDNKTAIIQLRKELGIDSGSKSNTNNDKKLVPAENNGGMNPLTVEEKNIEIYKSDYIYNSNTNEYWHKNQKGDKELMNSWFSLKS